MLNVIWPLQYDEFQLVIPVLSPDIVSISPSTILWVGLASETTRLRYCHIISLDDPHVVTVVTFDKSQTFQGRLQSKK
ncbi:hypothetical protein O9992_21870 [Vibrio lentus]|nr:hypothetical protein [Vibrio lentus]